MRAKPSQSSLLDVARHTGLSLATVSRVLSGAKHPMREETRLRVLQAARQLGYTPNAIARALATNVNRTVGIIIGDITDMYFAELVRGADDVARSHGHMTMICNADRNPIQEIAYLRALRAQNVAMILLAEGYYPKSAHSREVADAIAEVSREVRVICLTDRDVDGVPIVTVDICSAVHDLTRYLLGLGHPRIAYVRGPAGFSVSLDQQRGFEETMRDAGLDWSWQLPGGFGVSHGRIAAATLLSGPLPDAVIAASDDVAIGIISTFRQAGVNVPSRVSVAGIDDAKYSQILDLTTVRLPAYEIGAKAVGLGLEAGSVYLPARTLLAHRLIVRGSTTVSGSKAVPAQV